MMFRQFLPNLSLLIKMKGRKYALNMNARGVSWHPPAFLLLLSLSLSLLLASTIKSHFSCRLFIMFMVVLGNT